MRTKLVPEKALEMWRDGKNVTDIARALGYSPHSPKIVRKLIKQNFPGLNYRSEGARRRRESRAKVDAAKALELWNSGLNLRAIAAQFPGASRMAVSRAIRRAVERGLGVRVTALANIE